MKSKIKLPSWNAIGTGAPSGFTLVELLVCIAIVATLAFIGFSVAGRSKDKAKQVTAMGNLRSIATANAGFAAENFGKINTIRWDGDKEEGRPYVANSFWGRMEPYLFSGISQNNQPKLANELKARLQQLFSTSNPDTMAGTVLQGSRIYHDASGLPVPFGFNSELYPYNKWKRTSQIEDPSRVMYVTYGFGLVNEANSSEYAPRPTDNTSAPVYFMDNKKAMVVYLDGHVDSVSAPFDASMFK